MFISKRVLYLCNNNKQIEIMTSKLRFFTENFSEITFVQVSDLEKSKVLNRIKGDLQFGLVYEIGSLNEKVSWTTLTNKELEDKHFTIKQ